jgi:hypothetical protein
MTFRTMGLVSMLLALAIGAYLFTAQMQTNGPTSKSGQEIQKDATNVAATANFQAAAPALQAWFLEHGTYAGATLQGVFGVTLARADATSYCLQTGAGETAQHETGPGGQPAPGPC